MLSGKRVSDYGVGAEHFTICMIPCHLTRYVFISFQWTGLVRRAPSFCVDCNQVIMCLTGLPLNQFDHAGCSPLRLYS